MLKYHIQTIEVGSGGAADITFNNIPQNYDDLYLVHSIRTNVSGTADDMLLTINGSSSNFTLRRLFGRGSTLSSTTTPLRFAGMTTAVSSAANTFGSGAVTFTSYTSNAYKAYSVDGVNEDNATLAYQNIAAGLWSDTSAINSISLTSYNSGSLAQYSSASLYGIKRGSSGQVQTSPVAYGGTITTSGAYTYHSFTSSGTFTASKELNAEVLIVAGGGGGGSRQGNGGGAGGVLHGQLSFSEGTHSITVGAGGPGGAAASSNNYNPGTAGSNSLLDSFIAYGGGRGEGDSIEINTSGGSAGGSTVKSNSSIHLATQTSQSPLTGYGNSFEYTNQSFTGGGGAGGIGYSKDGGLGSVGRGGLAITLMGYTVAGGGGYTGGGAYGSWTPGPGGGGGAGNGSSFSTPGGSATANSGSGGGGCGYDYSSTPAGGNGGSGIVVIRYLTPA